MKNLSLKNLSFKSLSKSKFVCIVTAAAILTSGTYSQAGLLFGEGGLFQQMRHNRMARINARVSARESNRQARAASYGYGTYGCANCAVKTQSYSTSYGSDGSTGSYSSNGATGRYEALPVTDSYNSNGGVGAYQTLPNGCRIDARTGRLICPLSSTEVKVGCDNPNCICENCDCENCSCSNNSLVGVVAPLISEETSLVGRKAPEIKESTSYAAL